MTKVPQSPWHPPRNCLGGVGRWAACGTADGEDPGPPASLTIFLRKEGPRFPPSPGSRPLSSSGLQQGEELLPRLGGSGLGGLS